MATKVVMPKLSPTMEEGQIARWLKQEGDAVKMGEPLAEIDTDKAAMEMQALSEGTLRKIILEAGNSAPLGQMIAIIANPDEDISALLSEGDNSSDAPSNQGQEVGARGRETITKEDPAKEAPNQGHEAGTG
ncbi:MAG: biotin/lipoyl-containing protein, partial [Pyrinomonadaceae bacterium]